ncbi:hypothetical protein ZIOFF_009737 [Zingiber officinale]|uniref:Uncharacterized protein n=1 Tax=Zingiber officinale TaxID=94328 RepID=A0A8J5LYM5_ZINOF|nr:hypothetical protein ZIOFF_009737 [Zingiber officinale]
MSFLASASSFAQRGLAVLGDWVGEDPENHRRHDRLHEKGSWRRPRGSSDWRTIEGRIFVASLPYFDKEMRPFHIIVLEDMKEYISYAPKNGIKAQDCHPFDLLQVFINPKIKNKSHKTALFFEGC